MRLRQLFQCITPSGFHGSDVYFAPRADGSAVIRLAQGRKFLDAYLTASQADALATELLQGVYDAQQRRDYWPTSSADWPDAATWTAARNS